MSREKLRDPTRFGTMVMDPPPRKHSGTMVLEAPVVPPRPTPPPAPTFGARPCEPTCVLGEDYGHLSGLMTDEATAAADVGSLSEPLPFRAFERPSEPPRTFEPVAPPRPSSPPPQPPQPQPPAYMGSISPSESAVRPVARASHASAYRDERSPDRIEAARASTPPPRNDARASSEQRLSSLLHGPWLFPDDED